MLTAPCDGLRLRRLLLLLLRGLLGAGIFCLVLWLAFRRPAGGGLMLSVLMLASYVPLGYYVDRFFYSVRRARVRALKTTR